MKYIAWWSQKIYFFGVKTSIEEENKYDGGDFSVDPSLVTPPVIVSTLKRFC